MEHEPVYEVYATRWDDPRIVEELIPARGLEFSLPKSDHGACQFDATVEPGRSLWRQSISSVVSGLLVARDSVPVWQGWVLDEQQTGERTFSFTCAEWGSFFERVPVLSEAERAGNGRTYTNTFDSDLFQDVIAQAQAIARYNVRVQLGQPRGRATSTRTIESWDPIKVAKLLGEIGDADGGPEWYFGSAGDLINPVRQLMLADQLGQSTPQATLEYVEDTVPPQAVQSIPTVALLGDLFPGEGPIQVPTVRAGGNVIAMARSRNAASSSTIAEALGDGEGKAKKRKLATATPLLEAGWPGMTTTQSYDSVSDDKTLLRHAQADLAATAGVATGYSLVTLDGDPDWTQTSRGSALHVALDTDVFAGERPYEFVSRLQNLTVRLPDTGRAQVQWDLAQILEV
jgi:hypothetical protein